MNALHLSEHRNIKACCCALEAHKTSLYTLAKYLFYKFHKLNSIYREEPLCQSINKLLCDH